MVVLKQFHYVLNIAQLLHSMRMNITLMDKKLAKCYDRYHYTMQLCQILPNWKLLKEPLKKFLFFFYF
ncbi:hypothetical protein WUBG_08862 [Wuchereria bancrofti]|uniref:Uncharacterized protein n=1 Tax=Wuchereria bancrofti TaxID=6293 RepID=J9EYK2_WUCBA|nr:hypothetical protein WUBG_08862 [Wuchereria bancrofti]